MRWASDWRLYYVAAALFLIAGLIALFADGIGIRPVFGLVMCAAMAVLGNKARKDGQGEQPPG